MSEAAHVAHRGRFIDDVLAGRAGSDEIDDYVDDWHDLSDDASAARLELHEFLGLTWDEYRLCTERPESMRFILAARKAGRPVEEVMAASRMTGAAARSAEAREAEKVLDWLIERGRVTADIRETW